MGGVCSTLGGDDKFIQNFEKSLKGTESSEDFGVDGRVILKWI
jgi:hypothetical protein